MVIEVSSVNSLQISPPDSMGLTRTTYSLDMESLGNIVLDTQKVEDTSGESLHTSVTSVMYTGLIFLQAGVTYGFSGYLDDSLRIELGGRVVINTAMVSDALIDMGQVALSNESSNDLTVATFTPKIAGYYTLEIYVGNVSTYGNTVPDMVTDGIPAPLNTQNYSIYSDIGDLASIQDYIGHFVSDDDASAGFFPIKNVDTISHEPLVLNSNLTDTISTEITSTESFWLDSHIVDILDLRDFISGNETTIEQLADHIHIVSGINNGDASGVFLNKNGALNDADREALIADMLHNSQTTDNFLTFRDNIETITGEADNTTAQLQALVDLGLLVVDA